MKSISLFPALLSVALVPAVLQADPVSFRGDVAPLLQNQCIACHGPKKAEGGYRVDSYDRLVKEGDSGLTGIAAGSIEDSELLRRIVSDDEAERMPLDADPLPKESIELIQRWIEEGAKFDGEDSSADLVTIIPPPDHPDPPAEYPYTMPVTAVAFSANGNELYAGGYHEITVWNPQNGEMIRRIKNVGQRTFGLALHPGGNLLAVACGAPGRLGEARLFDPASGELKKVLGATSDVVLDVAFDPAGNRLAVAAADGITRVFEVDSGKEVLTITSHSDWVTAVAWNADGSKLASSSRDKTAKVFDAKTGELLVTYSGHSQPVKGVAFHPDNEQVYSAGADRKIHRWKIADAKKAAETGFGGEVFKLPIEGSFLFATSSDKTVRQFELGSQKQIRSYSGHNDWALSVDFHEASKRVASGGFDGRVHVWNAEDGKVVTSFYAAPGFSPSD